MMTTGDPLAIPASARARLDHLDAGRLQRISALHAAASEQRDRRRSEARQDFMHGKTDLPTYRGAVQASERALTTALVDVPPAPDVNLLHARVEARALEAVAGWWVAELDAAQRQQDTWTPATANAAEEEAPHAVA